MMTIVTQVTLREGAEPDWDSAMRERLAAAQDQPGWIGGQILIPLDGLNRRVIVGTWRTRADWEAWHTDRKFSETRRRLEGLESGANQHVWHEVVEDVRRHVTPLGEGDAAAARAA
jgi:heme-degrading monooxygenase HmoA